MVNLMTSVIPDDPDTLLRRDRTAEALTASGFPTAASTLATKASRGGGPPYEKYGPWPLYRWGNALAWAQSRLEEPRCTTSEASPTRGALPIKTRVVRQLDEAARGAERAVGVGTTKELVRAKTP
jgi:hypothetical protein